MTDSRDILLRISALRRQILTAFTPRLKPLGLTLQQYQLLWLIHEGQVQPSVMAERLSADRPTISRLLRAMRRAGWIESQRSPDDARREIVRLTRPGLAKFRQAARLRADFRVQVEKHLAPAEIDALHRLFSKLETAVNSEL